MAAKQLHILVVEDDDDGQELMASLLQHMNVNVDIAADAFEAERYLFQSGNNYDAALIDLALPDKNGWQLLSEVLAEQRTANLPCIAITAYHTSKLREEALMAGFRAYFPKPIDAMTFLRELENILR